MSLHKTRKVSKVHKFKTRKLHKRNSYAGKAIGAGGFGCIFKPHINCRSKKHKSNSKEKYVSKLMLNKYVKKEIKLIREVERNVKKIPNYTNYFLIDGVYDCKPSKLTKRDLVRFNSKCTNLKHKNITRKNINKRIDEVSIINLPYGGIDIDTYWYKWLKMGNSEKRNKSFAVTNICLLQLLMKGILKMNQSNYYHFDVKGSNILRTVNAGLISSKNIKTRMIDWGLAIKYTHGSIPKEVLNRPLQYNLPFSSILFQDDLQNKINRYVKEYTKHENDVSSDYGRKIILKGLASKLLEESQYRGRGHIDFVEEYIRNIYSSLFDTTKKDDFVRDIINVYNTQVLDDYTNENYEFNVDKYFKEIFIRNVDIWGFLMSYVDLITLTNPWKDKFQSIIVKVLTEYCFSSNYATKYIPVHKVVNDLITLNLAVKQPLHIKGYPKITSDYVASNYVKNRYI